MVWFLYDRDLRHERVKQQGQITTKKPTFSQIITQWLEKRTHNQGLINVVGSRSLCKRRYESEHSPLKPQFTFINL